MLIDTEHGVKPRYLTPSIVKDYAGNLFAAVIYYDDENHYDGRMRLWKVTPAGEKVLLGERLMSRAKGDGVGICQSGADVIVVMSGHIGDPDTDLELVEAFVGVAVAYPGGIQPGHGGAAAYTEGSTGTGGNGLTQEDKDWIAAEFDTKLAAFAQRWGDGGDIRQSEENKDKDALKEIFTDTDGRGQAFRAEFEDFLQKMMVRLWQAGSPDPDAQTFQARFDQDVRDRSYEADVSYGGGHKAEPQQEGK